MRPECLPPHWPDSISVGLEGKRDVRSAHWSVDIPLTTLFELPKHKTPARIT
jgi:hypothetical protein